MPPSDRNCVFATSNCWKYAINLKSVYGKLYWKIEENRSQPFDWAQSFGRVPRSAVVANDVITYAAGQVGTWYRSFSSPTPLLVLVLNRTLRHSNGYIMEKNCQISHIHIICTDIALRRPSTACSSFERTFTIRMDAMSNDVMKQFAAGVVAGLIDRIKPILRGPRR